MPGIGVGAFLPLVPGISHRSPMRWSSLIDQRYRLDSPALAQSWSLVRFAARLGAPHLDRQETHQRPRHPPPTPFPSGHPMPRPTRSAGKRGYDWRWELEAARFKQAYPWCMACEAIGLHRRSQVIDHIVPPRGDKRLFYDQTNWQACCRWHHDAIKQSLELQYQLGRVVARDLLLTSPVAVRLARARHRPAIGADGYPIPGT